MRDMRELRAASTIANCPNIGRRRLQTVVERVLYAARIQFDARCVEADAGGVRNAPDRDQDVARLDRLRAGGRTRGEADALAGSAPHGNGLGRQYDQSGRVSVSSSSGRPNAGGIGRVQLKSLGTP